MANLTVTVDDRILKKARIRALENGTSVNAVVGDYLQRYAGLSQTESALAEFVELASKSAASSGPEGRTWRREDLYDRPKYLRPG
jgi:plasmid stability protein